MAPRRWRRQTDNRACLRHSRFAVSPPPEATTTAEKLKLALEKADKANKRVAILKHKVENGERARATQQECALGGVLFAIAERGEPQDLCLVDYVTKFFAQSTSGSAASNRAVLVGTVFDTTVAKAIVDTVAVAA